MKCTLLLLFCLIFTVSCNDYEIYKSKNQIKFTKLTKQAEPLDWWEGATFYQIYPRSFKDSDNDGIGDIQGIIQKLPHLITLGVTATWLSPIFKSPQVDQGYDISDYRDIDPIFGTIDDFKQFLESAHYGGLKIILDFVPNHTSDQHQWFKDSVARKEGYEDFYVWSDGKIDENGNRVPPNNWVSVFGGSAWEWNEERQQYYLHQFATAQPDLNYRNKDVVKEMKDVLTYWLDFGVDGFRVDAISCLFEDADLLDEPRPNIYTKDLNETFEMVYEWRDLLDEYTASHSGPTRVMMTEAYVDIATSLRYYGLEDQSRLGAHFSFNFDLLSLVEDSDAHDVMKIVSKWMDIGGYSSYVKKNWVLGNHDQHRVATRMGKERVDILNMLTAVIPDIQVTYNGEEIGQENGEVTCEEGQDPSAIKDCSTFDQVSRDFERTPFQWDTSVNAGFNDGAKPWLPVSEKYNETNLADQDVIGLPSHVNVYREVQTIRDIFQFVPWNSWEIIVNEDYVVTVGRTLESEILIAAIINLSDDVKENIYLSGWNNCTIMVTSSNSARNVTDEIDPAVPISLDPYEGFIYATAVPS